MNIYEKILKVRIGFLSADVKKSGENKYAGYSYFDLQDIIPTIENLCAEYGVFPLISHGAEQSVLKLINIEKPDEYVEITSPTSTAKLKGAHDVQNLGAVQTYLRRYLYMTAFDIVECDQLDKTQGKEAKKGSKENPIDPVTEGTIPEKLTDEQKSEIMTMITQLASYRSVNSDTIIKDIETGYKTKLDNLTPNQAIRVKSQLAEMIAPFLKTS